MTAPAAAEAAERWVVDTGDCIAVMRQLPDNCVDAIVTDPPYGMSSDPDIEEVLRHWLAGDRYEHGGGGFMGKTWDSFVPGPEYWRECFRVLKPGGHLLAFAASRTYDLMAIAIRFARFQVRDMVEWMYGTGFPKSLDVSKAIDKVAGATREVVGSKLGLPGYSLAPDRGRGVACVAHGDSEKECAITAPATNAAKRWQGWGTALKPGHEPVVMARKPLEGTVIENVERWGTGALNIDASRIPTNGETFSVPQSDPRNRKGATITCGGDSTVEKMQAAQRASIERTAMLGRWPANALLDEGAANDLDLQQDGASRFFYVAKASRAEREAGCEQLPQRTAGETTDREDGSAGLNSPRAGAGRTSGARNHHPTVKPVALMRHLVRLVTPPGGSVLDPFCGSGTTGMAAVAEGFEFMGIEQDPDYAEIARARIAAYELATKV